jgi:hypothetical protein
MSAKAEPFRKTAADRNSRKAKNFRPFDKNRLFTIKPLSSLRILKEPGTKGLQEA